MEKNVNVTKLVELHMEIIDELRTNKIDKLDADAIATQTSRILNAIRVQRDIIDMTGSKCPNNLMAFAEIEKLKDVDSN